MGESNLGNLLRSMEPLLAEGQFVFASVKPDDHLTATNLLQNVHLAGVRGVICEAEGSTFIVAKPFADTIGLEYNKTFIAACITLNVHSALDAVGLTAAISKALSQGGISCNVLAGAYHDHLFVGSSDAGSAMEILRDLGHSS